MCVDAAGRMSLRPTVGPGSGVPCSRALTGTAHEPAPDSPAPGGGQPRERFMKRAMSWALLVAGTALAVSATPAIPAAAAMSGSETLSGTIVFAATGATTRTVIGSAVRARGVFKGVGRFVEIVFGDPVSQDDLVFPGGTLHVLSTTGGP